MLASANPHKATEIAAVLSAALEVELVPRPDDVPEVVEDGETLLDNARLKARALVAATGPAAVADDTGLEVDALGGAPGVYSARYAGEDATYADNVAKLLRELARAGRRRRRAPGPLQDGGAGGLPRRLRGVGRGRDGGDDRHRAAGRHGFGYDPVFEPAGGDGRTFAEMTPAEKDAVSHRGRAFRALARLLAEHGGPA